MNRWMLVAVAALWACDDGGDGGATPDNTPDATQGAGGEGGAGGGAGEGGAGGAGGGAGEGGAGGAGGEVIEARLQSLSIEAPEALFAGRGHTFRLIGTFDDGTERDVAAEADWTSDNADIVAFSGANGVAELPYGGAAKVRAELDGQMAELDVSVDCDYPRYPANIRLGQAVAPVKWDVAFREDGTEIEFDFRKAMCSVEYKDVNAFLLIANAEWCAPCIQEIRRIGPEAQELLDQGGMLLYIVIQNLEYRPATSQSANRHIGRLVGPDSPGIRMGGGEAVPQSFFDNPAIIQAFPTTFVVRKSDMQVIADSRALNYHLDPYFPAILADLEQDWRDPAASVMIPFDSNCEAGDDEAGEPNDMAGQATPIAPGTYEGGICTAAPDFYRIETEGPWTFTVNFSHAQGDIDIALWDEATNNVARVNGQPVQSAGTADFETISGNGPGVVIVVGYGGASATYSVTLE